MLTILDVIPFKIILWAHINNPWCSAWGACWLMLTNYSLNFKMGFLSKKWTLVHLLSSSMRFIINHNACFFTHLLFSTVDFSSFKKKKTELIQELSRNLARMKSVSATTMNFFRTIDSHALELKKVLEESQMAHQKQLFQLQNKFEVILCCSHIFYRFLTSMWRPF